MLELITYDVWQLDAEPHRRRLLFRAPPRPLPALDHYATDSSGVGDVGKWWRWHLRARQLLRCPSTNGLARPTTPSGELFGNPPVLNHVVNLRSRPALPILEAVFFFKSSVPPRALPFSPPPLFPV